LRDGFSGRHKGLLIVVRPETRHQLHHRLSSIQQFSGSIPLVGSTPFGYHPMLYAAVQAMGRLTASVQRILARQSSWLYTPELPQQATLEYTII
jgi:hypothetical protein